MRCNIYMYIYLFIYTRPAQGSLFISAIHIFIHSAAACRTTFPVPNNEGRWESLSHKLLTIQGSPKKAPGQDLAQKGCFPRIPEGTFNCWRASHQNPKIWLQKVPGQDLAQKGYFPRMPEGTLSAGLQATKVPKSGFKRLLARIWPKTAVSQ